MSNRIDSWIEERLAHRIGQVVAVFLFVVALCALSWLIGYVVFPAIGGVFR